MSAASEALYFVGKRQVEVRAEAPAELRPGQARVVVRRSGISAGTEMLMFRGEMPEELPLDVNIANMAEKARYPFRYGYSAVGEVVEVGEGVADEWLGRLVFAFQPHGSQLVADLNHLLPCPEGIEVEDAVFLPNMETAVNFVLDGGPMLGEKVVVLGQGVVGLLTTALLARFPLKELLAFDAKRARRAAALECGAQQSFDPADPAQVQAARATLGQGDYAGADLIYEISGAPEALDLAIGLAGFNGRIIAGSWYGAKRAALDLGSAFHRQRIRLESSQVSTLAPELSGRWSKARRFAAAWELLGDIRPARWITHRFPLAEAQQAYELIDQNPEQVLQVVFTY
ncbi:MAG: zinc-binding alcohol dehydrogenase [Chloroflexi bacterium]|nr:zinc-binding alcohol dehydrogenase [Chloroflexota bacterium]